MRTFEEQKLIFECWNKQLKTLETSKILNIPRRTIADYYKRFSTGTYPNWQQEEDSKSFGESPCEFKSRRAYYNLNKKAYSYLFGMYLGDGCITETKKQKNNSSIYRFRLVQDAKYKRLILEQKETVEQVFPNNKVSVHKAPGCEIISMYSTTLKMLFPQHDKGKKHERKITLEKWQNEILDLYPQEFIKGLIITDGCRYLNKIGKYEYVNYSFTNMSDDIHSLFEIFSAKLGIKTRRSGIQSIVSNRKSVEILDSFIGPKS